MTVRMAISWPSTWPGTRSPGRARTSRASSGSSASASSTVTGSQSASSSRRQRSTAGPTSRRSSTVSRQRTCPRAATPSSSSSTTRPGPCGRRRVRAYQPGPQDSTPATAWAARKASTWPAAYGARTASRRSRGPDAGAPEPTPPGGAELGGRGGVDLADGLVELPDAGEAGGERHVAEGHGRGLHEHPRGLRPAGPGQGERPGPELGDEQPVEVPRGVADPVREPLDPVALDDPVGDQPHRPAGDVGCDVPVR